MLLATEATTSKHGVAKQSPYSELEDSVLMDLVCQANNDAFTEVVNRHTDHCWRLAMRTLGNKADADDVVQKVFIKLWQKPRAWNSKVSALTTWLYTVTLNASRDVQRSYKRTHHSEIGDYEDQLAWDSIEQLQLDSEIKKQRLIMHQAVKLLPENQRDAINLAVFIGLPQSQVAEILGVTVKAVESLLARAKKKLKGEVQQKIARGEWKV